MHFNYDHDWEFFSQLKMCSNIIRRGNNEIFRDIIQKYINFSERLTTDPVIQIVFNATPIAFIDAPDVPRECRSLVRSIFDIDVTAHAISECVPRDNSDCQVATISRILSQIRQSTRATGVKLKRIQ